MATSNNDTASLLDQAKNEYMQGASDVEIAKLLGVTIARFYQMYEELPDFAKFVDHGRTLSQAWWMANARKNLWNKDFNTSLWNFNMKNRYGWADKVDSKDTTNTDPVDLDQVKGQIASMVQRLAKTNPELLRTLNVSTDQD